MVAEPKKPIPLTIWAHIRAGSAFGDSYLSLK